MSFTFLQAEKLECANKLAQARKLLREVRAEAKTLCPNEATAHNFEEDLGDVLKVVEGLLTSIVSNDHIKGLTS